MRRVEGRQGREDPPSSTSACGMVLSRGVTLPPAACGTSTSLLSGVYSSLTAGTGLGVALNSSFSRKHNSGVRSALVSMPADVPR